MDLHGVLGSIRVIKSHSNRFYKDLHGVHGTMGAKELLNRFYMDLHGSKVNIFGVIGC